MGHPAFVRGMECGERQTNEEGCGAMAQLSSIEPESWTLDDLVQLGTMLDKRPARLGGRTVGMELAGRILRVRGKDGRTWPMLRRSCLSSGAGSGTLC
jgi:hypothetical protein